MQKIKKKKHKKNKIKHLKPQKQKVKTNKQQQNKSKNVKINVLLRNQKRYKKCAFILISWGVLSNTGRGLVTAASIAATLFENILYGAWGIFRSQRSIYSAVLSLQGICCVQLACTCCCCCSWRVSRRGRGTDR